MIKKKYLPLFLLVFILWGCQGKHGDTAANSGKVQIGVITIQTGPAADYGKYTTNGINMALKEIGDPSIELVFKDSKAEPQEAIRVFKELRASGVPLIIGPFTSTETKQVGPEAQSTSTVLLTSSATADELSQIGNYVFMMLPPNVKQGDNQARYAIDSLKARRAAILYGMIPYGQTMRESFTKAFTAAGGAIVADEAYPDGQEDFRDVLKKIAATGPDVVFIPVQDSQAGRILRQAREVNFPSALSLIHI